MNNNTQKIGRLATPIVATICAAASFAGTFRDIPSDETAAGERWISYTGEVEQKDVATYESLLKGEDQIILVINSPGGDFLTGIKLGKLTRNYRDEVTIYVDKAYSAAALWTIGDDNYDWLTEDAELGFHLPYIYGKDAKSGTEQNVGYIMGRYLEDVFGEDDATQFLAALGQIRDQYGKFAMLCFAPDKDPYIKK